MAVAKLVKEYIKTHPGSQKLHELLGFDGRVEDYSWKWQQLPPGQKLQAPQPLFTKLDEKVVDEEYSRLRAAD